MKPAQTTSSTPRAASHSAIAASRRALSPPCSASAKTASSMPAARARSSANASALLEQTPAIVAARPCTCSISAARFEPEPETSTPMRLIRRPAPPAAPHQRYSTPVPATISPTCQASHPAPAQAASAASAPVGGTIAT